MSGKKNKESKVSKGERRSIDKSIVAYLKKERSPLDRAMNKLEAWKSGKNPWIFVSTGRGSDMKQTRIRANEGWGDPKRTANIYKTKGGEEQ